MLRLRSGKSSKREDRTIFGRRFHEINLEKVNFLR